MITAYILNNKVLDIVTLGPDDIVPDNTVWLDAYKPDTAEREWLTGLFLEEVPDKEELDDIEASARFYWDTDVAKPPESRVPDQRIVTVRPRPRLSAVAPSVRRTVTNRPDGANVR